MLLFYPENKEAMNVLCFFLPLLSICCEVVKYQANNRRKGLLWVLKLGSCLVGSTTCIVRYHFGLCLALVPISSRGF